MFEKVGVPILGIVENMAVHVCSNCGHAEHIFGEGGGQRMAAEYGVEYLGALPLAMSIREQADSGHPTVVADPEGEIAAVYRLVARKVAVKIAQKSKDFLGQVPDASRSPRTPEADAPGSPSLRAAIPGKVLNFPNPAVGRLDASA